VPPILVAAPPEFGEPRGAAAEKVKGARAKAIGLAEAYAEVASQHGCTFFAAGNVVYSSQVDGVHLDSEAHRKLGLALARVVGESS
jgi:lysophospholipase L1-like esterase